MSIAIIVGLGKMARDVLEICFLRNLFASRIFFPVWTASEKNRSSAPLCWIYVQMNILGLFLLSSAAA